MPSVESWRQGAKTLADVLYAHIHPYPNYPHNSSVSTFFLLSSFFYVHVRALEIAVPVGSISELAAPTCPRSAA